MSVLSVDSLNVQHGQLKAVRNVSFTLNKGDIVALVGANGAGKTTLLRALAGAHIAHSGTIFLNGQEVTLSPPQNRVRAGLALVPEGRRLFSQMTVEENLALGDAAGRNGVWTIDKVFHTFPNLKARRHAKAGNLSGGEQQATAIGRALVSNPDVILLDEVSLGLSPLVVGQVYESLKGLIHSGTTIVLVEQDLTRAMDVASRVICMLEGELILDRPVVDVTRQEITDAYFGLAKTRHNGGVQ